MDNDVQKENSPTKTENNTNNINNPQQPLTNSTTNSDINENNNNKITEETPQKTPKGECEKKVNYSQLVKDYLKTSCQEEEYENIIKNNPDILFESLPEQKLILWESLLYLHTSPSRKNSDGEILTVTLDRPDQKVIKNDCIRTRVRESKLIAGYPKILEVILTYYCTSKNIKYKQGLNEVFAPLVLLKYKFQNTKFAKIFEIGEVFIDIFLPNYFYEEELFSLKSGISLFFLLLRYHEPSVYNRLDTMEILPEMYITNPITTLMIGKLKLNLVYEMLDKIIKTDDSLIIFFVLVSLIKINREMIINCDTSYLATLMTTLTIRNTEELNKVFDMALKLRELTPYSFRILANKIGFLEKKNFNIKKNFEFYKPDTLPAMPIFPLEIFHITNSEKYICADPDCKNSQKLNIQQNDNDNDDDSEEIGSIFKFQEHLYNHRCEKCDMKIEKKMQNVLLDLRILNYDNNKEDSDTEKTGFLPKMINVDEEELKSEDLNEILTDRFVSVRGIYHFIFLTSNTDAFSDFETNFYSDNLTDYDKKKMLFGIVKQQKVDKKLNLDDAQKNLTPKQIYKLKEYDNFRKTLKSMQKENFPYVSFVYGGFSAVHDESFKYGYELLFHNEKDCILCQEKLNSKKLKKLKAKEMKKKSNKSNNQLSNILWEHKKKVKYSILCEKYKHIKNSTFLGVLTNFKNKELEKDKIKILFVLDYENLEIELYKFDIKKQYQNIETDYDNTEIKKKNSAYYDLGKEIDTDKGDVDLILMETIFVPDVLQINCEKTKNIVSISIRDDSIEKEKDKKKKRNSVPEIIHIIVDFSSSNISKDFIKSFRIMTDNYKEKHKKK